MESQYEDINFRIRMNLLKCERFKTLREDPPNKKYLLREGYDSLHGLKIVTDDNDDLNKAVQVQVPVPGVNIGKGSSATSSVAKDEEAKRKETKEEKLVKEEKAAEEEKLVKDEQVEEDDDEEKKASKEKEELFEIEEELEYEYEEIPERKKAAELAAQKEMEAGNKVAGDKKKAATEKGKAAETKGKGEADENKEAEVVEVIKASTGGFRDGIKRIDIVLVVEDNASSNTDSIKLDFLSNILKIGLEIEIELGKMEMHKNLCFIKIHAPDSVLKEYGDMFAVKRYYVNGRMALIKGSLEMEWLKIIRNNYTTPDGYSNYERSLIVYKILRHLPFGEHVNQYGIHLLLKRNIILDAYALHDGPYFNVPNQSATGANGRQILYYNWVGLQNIFQFQPLHVIHEYLGPKIAFYYAFYGFYNVALALASIAGIISLRMPYYYWAELVAFREFACHNKDKYTICPPCYQISCHERDISEYCDWIRLNSLLDHPHVFYYVLFMTCWALVFIALWRRKEYLLNWMWEVDGRDSYYATSRRPEFNVDYQNPIRSARTGLKYDESGIYKMIRIPLSIIHTVACLIASVALMHECRKFRRKFADSILLERNTRKPVFYDYIYVALFQLFYTLLASVVEVVLHFLYYYLVDAENHRSYKEYEKSLVTKQFELSMLLIYPYICYNAWMEGVNNAYYSACRTPSFSPLLHLFSTFDKYLWTPWHQMGLRGGYRGPDCYSFCFPFSCIIEVGVLLMVMLVIKQVAFRLIFNTYRFMTDYNIAGKFNEVIPSWEREYILSEFNDAKLTRNYMILAVQFSLVTFFVIAFPLAPLLVLIVNVWEMRHSARRLLLASRRPLLIRSPGIGAWNNIFIFIAYFAIFTNALNLVLLSKMNLRIKLRENITNPLTSYTFQYLFPVINLERSFVPRHKECRAPYLLYEQTQPVINRYKLEFVRGDYALRSDYYHIHFISFRIFSMFLLCMLFFGFVVQYIFRPYRRDVEKTRAKEYRLKHLFTHYESVQKSDNIKTDLDKSLLNDKIKT